MNTELAKLPGIKLFRLDGRVAIVTGGSKGLGAAMATGLASAGANLLLVSRNQQQAVETAEHFRPDIALIDLGLPKLNGFDVCRRIRETEWGKHVTLIAQTGYGGDEDKRRSREAGFNGHLVKPADPITVLRIVDAGHDVTPAELTRKR